MKSIISMLLFLGGTIGITTAYSPLTHNQNQQIDMQLSGFSNFSPKEKKEKSESFLNLAQKSLKIYQTFKGGSTKIPGAKLTKEDRIFIRQAVTNIQKQEPKDQIQSLQELKETWLMSQELGRALQIEASPKFEGYAITKSPTPVYWLNKNDIDINKILGGGNGTGIKLDKQNLIRELAVVLPEQTPLTLIEKYNIGNFIYYEVRNREFDGGLGAKYAYFIDSRFIEKTPQKVPEQTAPLPAKSTIIKNLLSTKKAAYVRGGSRYQGLSKMETLFPSATKLPYQHQKQKNLNGVDCSGLLREATKGNTPRNTRQLLAFGTGIHIEGKSLSEIIPLLKPLDIIVWDGHIVIVLNQAQTIESRRRANFKGGVEIRPIQERLKEIMINRIPVNNYKESKLNKHKKFVIRRRYEEI